MGKLSGPVSRRPAPWTLLAIGLSVAVIAVTLLLRTIPGRSPGASATAAASAPATSLAAGGSASPAPSIADFAWAGLEWAKPSTVPYGWGITQIVDWNGGLVAAVTGGQRNPVTDIWHSTDGVNWTADPRTQTLFGNAGALTVAAGPRGLIVRGSPNLLVSAGLTPVAPGYANSAPLLWVSPDGAEWTRVADTTAFGDAVVLQVAAGRAGFVAIGQDSADRIWFSSSGTDWQVVPLPPGVFGGADFYALRATESGFVIAGHTASSSTQPETVKPAAWWSADGRSWSKATVESDSVGRSMATLNVGSGGLLGLEGAQSDHGAGAWSSVDGREWRLIEPPLAQSGGSAIVTDDGRHMVSSGLVLGGLSMLSSEDGITWTPLVFSGDTTILPGDLSSSHDIGNTPLTQDPLNPAYELYVLRDGVVATGVAIYGELWHGQTLWRARAVP